ncbi:unnamed protein product, partial [Owenia fusiformis]
SGMSNTFILRMNPYNQDNAVSRFATLDQLNEPPEQDSNNRTKCVVCNRQFTSKSNLNQHMKIHEAKSLACHICCKLFRRMTHLRRHVLDVHGKEYIGARNRKSSSPK